MSKLKKNNKIFIAGHNGMVGSAIERKLIQEGFKNILTYSSKELDLRDQLSVDKFYKKEKPDFVILAAAKVGGIHANNKYKAEFIYNNLSIQTNLIHSAYLNKINNLIFLGSSCVYPRNCKQPIKEEYLMNGKLEETNDAYAVAKIAGLKMCQSYNQQYGTNYKCLMPTNTFGPNDNYDDMNSHFFPALIKKIHKLKIKKKHNLKLWGNGKAKREVIYVDDVADACIYFMKKKIKETIINIGTGKDYTIKDYAKIIISEIYPNNKVKIIFDTSKPNGTPRKVLNVSLAKKYGWIAKNKLRNSIQKTYKEFKKSI